MNVRAFQPKQLVAPIAALSMTVMLLSACGGAVAPAAVEAPPPTAAPAEAAPADSAPAPAQDAAADTPAETGAALAFQIVPGQAEARFLIDEVLMGQDKTVVGATAQVEGVITVDPANPAAAQVGEIRVDARDLTTDDDRRTGQLRRAILKSGQDQYRYITFSPTSVAGMPDTVAVGQEFSFQVTGDLTILDTTLPVTFDMTVTPVSATTLQGSGATTVRYADFGISIPSVPFVAGVQDDVRLEIDFTANAAS